jgi:hypothetical protein
MLRTEDLLTPRGVQAGKHVSGLEWAGTWDLVRCVMYNHAVISSEFFFSFDIFVHEISNAIVSQYIPKFKPTRREARVVDETKSCHGVVFVPFSIQVYASASTGGKKESMRR